MTPRRATDDGNVSAIRPADNVDSGLSDPAYAPFRPGPFRLSMGLVPLDLREWIEVDAHLATELQEKERLLRERHHEVFAVLPEAARSSAEVLALLVDHLPYRFPTCYRRAGERFDNLITGQSWNLSASTLHPLDLAGRLVQEDICLMQQQPGTTTYRLVGAAVCFPTRWHLAAKMGRSLAEIHNPVPGYPEQLTSPMDRFFARLKIARPVWRINWSLIDDPALFQPKRYKPLAHKTPITERNAGDTVWLRMERQTLRRLPQSGDIVFTIRVYVRPLHALATQPERAAALAAAIRALPPAMQQYKGLPALRDAVLAWLEQVALMS